MRIDVIKCVKMTSIFKYKLFLQFNNIFIKIIKLFVPIIIISGDLQIYKESGVG